MAKRVPKKVEAGKGGELVRPNFIRVETILRKYPLHLLQSQGSSMKEIVIRDLNDDGNEVLRWRVRFESSEGIPGPLAYRVDRLIIDRAIEAQTRNGEPPSIVRLGTLNEMCDALDIAPAGTNKVAIQKALYQLKGTDIEFDGCDAQSRFTRYPGITLTGKKLPDGTRADAVYVSLSPEYQAILRRASRRPLDYDYMKTLPPAVARLYEIISSRIFAALNSGSKNPEARILYSEFCELSALTRYFTQWEVTRQMKRLNKPHISSGYISSVSYTPRLDRNGKPDWMMVYAPGAKARSEFDAAKGRGDVPEPAPVLDLQKPLLLPPIAPPTEKQTLAQRLAEAGVSHVRAQALVELHEASARLWLDVVAKGFMPKRVREVGAYLTAAIGSSQPPPAAYRKALDAERCQVLPPTRQRTPTKPMPPIDVSTLDPLDALTDDELTALEAEARATVPASLSLLIRSWDRSSSGLRDLMRECLTAGT